MREILGYSKWGSVEEKLTLRIKADENWDIYIPTAWYSEEGKQDCKYDWIVGIDGREGTNYKGTGSSNGKIRVGFGLNPLSTHTVTINPSKEEYGWLRAFGYKGTDIGSSLINIISDKSYKWFWLSEKFSWDYFKAYQYYGCSNLINTDEELLPNTLEIIGNNYRYYEYAGCTKLVRNAEEKILKSVKAIGDNYRVCQYENCTGINRINMRAINWASVWSNYRNNQFSWAGTDRSPMDIYIEWGIEEGGEWWLVNSKVRGVFVYKWLVSDYQTKLSTITSSKIKKNEEWDNFEYEFIEYIGIADSSGEIRIPVGWFSTSFTQDCDYDWLVSIDWGEEEEITGTGGNTYVSVGSWLTEWSEYRVVIKPKEVEYWWWRAFWFHTTGAQAYIKEIIHDSYKCYAINRVETGDYYKYWTFAGCTNLVNSYEKLPTSVETIGDYYMKECYGGCTGLERAFYEVLHKGCVVGEDYRYHEYTGCSAMEIHEWIAGYMGGTYPTNYKYQYLSWAGNDLEVYITRYEELGSWLTNSLWLADSNVKNVYVYVDNLYWYINNSNWSNISDIKFQVYYYDYVVKEVVDIDKYTKLVGSYEMPVRPITSNFAYRIWGFDEVKRGVWAFSKNSYDVRVPWETYGRIWGTVFWTIYTVRWVWAENVAIDTGEGNDYSTWSGGDIDWNVRNFYVDYSGKITYAKGRRSSWGTVYKDIRGRTNFSINSPYSGWQPCISASRDWRYLFIDGKQYYSSTKWGSWSEYRNYSWSYTSMEFSDDWMTVYLASDFGKIEQYNLGAPWDLSSKTSAGKEKNISGQFAFSKDYKYLYVYDGRLSVYEYEW